MTLIPEQAKFTLRSHTTPAGYTMHHIHVCGHYLFTVGCRTQSEKSGALHSSAPQSEHDAYLASAQKVCADATTRKYTKSEKQYIAYAVSHPI
jgi:hypothetical protein